MILKTAMGASLAVLALTLSACKDTSETKTNAAVKTTPAVKTVAAKSSDAILGSFGVETANIDSRVKPGDNFYAHVNGNWLKNTEIPADKSRYGSFIILRDKAEKRVRGIIESAANKETPSADEKRIGDFYNAYLNTCLLYTSPSPRDQRGSRMPSSA